MIKSSIASRSDVSQSRGNTPSIPAISNPRFGAGYLVRAETAPVKMECDQKHKVHSAEPVAQQEVPKKKFALMSAANINTPCPRVSEENVGAVKMESCESMVTEEASHGTSVYDVGDDTPDHKACNELSWPGHTDACWNDPRWNDRNQKIRAITEQQIQSGLYHNRPDKKFTIMSRDQRFKTELSSFTHREHSCYGYSNIRVIRCEDAAILANINSNFDSPFWHLFHWNGHQCLLSGRNAVTPVVVNLDTGKAYEQRGDQYNAFELEWYAVEASPDGKTFLAKGSLSAGWEDEYRFYDASKPEHGFRCLLPGELSIIGIPDKRDATTPEWGVDQDGRTIVSLTVRNGHDKDKSVDENGDLAVFRTVFRREEDRMVVVSGEAIPLRTDSSSSADDLDSDSQLSDNDELYA